MGWPFTKSLGGPPEHEQNDDADDNGEDGGASAGMGQNFEQHRQEVV
jgi:hypothetical protein